MAKTYFFTDPILLESQISEDAYGPIDSNNFNVTSMHRLAASGVPTETNIPAYAVFDGQVFVQESDEVYGADNKKLLNIIFKPLEQQGLGSAKVRYFIYKGITRESILLEWEEGVDLRIAIADENTNDLTKVLHKYNKKRKLTGDVSVNSIGYNYNYVPADGPIPAKGAPDSMPFDSTIFVVKSNTTDIEDVEFFEFPIVKGGSLIGNFFKDSTSSKIGFEIVLEGTKQKLTFGDIRANKKIITVSTSDDIAVAVREKILDYIDPCAYFGSFYFEKKGIKVGGKKQTSDEIYENVIKGFFNKNKIYLDIRNENTYSYPYRGYYTDSIKITGGITTYSTMGWPIKILGNITPVNSDKVNELLINLPKGDNRIIEDVESILYVASGYFFDSYPKLNKKQKKIRFKNLNYISSADTAEIQLAYPANKAGTTICTYIQLHYIKKNKSYNAPPPGYKIVPTLSQFDNLFPIREMLLTLPQTDSYETTYVKSYGIKFVDNTYVIDNNLYGFAGMMEYGIVYSNLGVVLYAYPIDSYVDGGSLPYDYTKLQGGANNDFFKTLTNKISNIQISRCTLDITDVLNVGTVSLESIPNSASITDYRAKYNFYALALSKIEFNELLTQTNTSYSYTTDALFQNTSGYHYATAVLTATNVYADNNEKLYIKSNLKISGFKASNEYFVDPDYTLELYSSDGILFCSTGFFKSVPSNKYSCLRDNRIAFSDEDRGAVIKRLSVSPTSSSWSLYKTIDAIQIDISLYPNSKEDYYGKPIGGTEVKLVAGTRVVLLGLTTKKLIGYNDILFTVYRVVCFYNNEFREGWVSQQALVDSGEIFNYFKGKVKVRLTANNRTFYYKNKDNSSSSQTIKRDITMYTFFNDAYMDLEIMRVILSDFEVLDGKFYDMYTNVKASLATFIDKYKKDLTPADEAAKTVFYDKLVALSNQRDSLNSIPLSDVINYEKEQSNDSNVNKYIDEDTTLTNFAAKLFIKDKFQVIQEDKIEDYNKILVMRVADFWIDKLYSDDPGTFPTLNQVLTGETTRYLGAEFWDEIVSTSPERPVHVLSDPQYSSSKIAFEKSFREVQQYLHDRSNAAFPIVNTSESGWILIEELWEPGTPGTSKIADFDVFIIQSDYWPLRGEPNEASSIKVFSSDRYIRMPSVDVGNLQEYKRYLQLDSSYSTVNCNNLFAVFVNEIIQKDAGYILCGGNTESGYQVDSFTSATNVFWTFTKEKTFTEMLLPLDNNGIGLDFITDSDIEYIGTDADKVAGMRLKDFFQRNPVFGMFYLKAFIEYLNK